jgi:hypothetical protein
MADYHAVLIGNSVGSRPLPHRVPRTLFTCMDEIFGRHTVAVAINGGC